MRARKGRESIRTVVKLGGSLLEDSILRGRALQAIASRLAAGEKLLIVHGGGKRIDAGLAALGIPRCVRGGLRVTDRRTLEVVVAELCGTVNKLLVAELGARGVRCAGISGADAGTLRAELHPPVHGTDLGFVGRILGVDPALPAALLRAGFLPVIAPVALGPGQTLLNVNADAAAAALAGALSARRLVFLTDVPGLLDGDGRLVERLGAAEAARLTDTASVAGGMRPKLLACVAALEAGVAKVLIAGPDRHETVLSDGKGGTCLVAA